MTIFAKELIIKARHKALTVKDYQKAFQFLGEAEKVLPEEEKIFFKRTLALVYLENKEYQKASVIYREINEDYQAGFCELLLGNEDEAKRLWSSAPESAPCEWGKCLLDFIKLKKGRIPTFLQIRNHLEIDIGYFIQANKIKYAENLIKNENVFISVNLESYKLIGRVLLNYGFLNQARKYLVKSLQILPNESETLYYLGMYNYKIGAYKESRQALSCCLDNNRCYTPARDLLAKIELKQGEVW